MTLAPYYADDWVTVYHGDARDVLPELASVDAVVTDPPYGLDFEYDEWQDTREAWHALMDDVVPLLRMLAPFVVLPTCGIDRLPWWYANHAPDWLLAWYKGSPGHLSKVGFNAWEALVVYGRPPRPIHDYFQSPCGFDPNGHPCPKPVGWATWLVSRACLPGGTVLDPFCGSGTVLRAAKSLNRHAVGVELSERYCEIIASRAAQGVLHLGGV